MLRLVGPVPRKIFHQYKKLIFLLPSGFFKLLFKKKFNEIEEYNSKIKNIKNNCNTSYVGFFSLVLPFILD